MISFYIGGLLIGLSIALAGAPSGVKVFGEEKPVYWRETASGHSRSAYFIGKSISVLYRIIFASGHFTAMFYLLALPTFSVEMQFLLFFLTFVGV
jgi:hypothetical protein